MGEPVFGLDGARTSEEIEKWAAQVEAKAARYQDMQQQVSAVTSSASSRDGIVHATVTSSGTVQDLQVSDDVRRLSGAGVAASVMSAIQRAQAGITEQVASVMTDTVGDDDVTVNAVVSSYRQRFPDPDAAENNADDEDEPPDDDGDFSDESFLQ